MKKGFLVLAAAMLCAGLVGCINVGGTGGAGSADGPDAPGYDRPDNPGSVGEIDIDSAALPVVDWWHIYKASTGWNTLVVQVSNPNPFPVQFSYDLVFYKGGEVVQTESLWAMTCLEPERPGIIFADVSMPAAGSVDKVALENIEMTPFPWRPIDSTFTPSFADNGQQYFDVKFSEKPASSEIWAVLYNDANGDGRVQGNEFVDMGAWAFFDNIYEQEGELSLPLPDGSLNYTDYYIYCTAFVME